MCLYLRLLSKEFVSPTISFLDDKCVFVGFIYGYSKPIKLRLQYDARSSIYGKICKPWSHHGLLHCRDDFKEPYLFKSV